MGKKEMVLGSKLVKILESLRFEVDEDTYYQLTYDEEFCSIETDTSVFRPEYFISPKSFLIAAKRLERGENDYPLRVVNNTLVWRGLPFVGDIVVSYNVYKKDILTLANELKKVCKAVFDNYCRNIVYWNSP